MSEQRGSGPYTAEEIETLRSLYSNEKVAYLLSIQDEPPEEDDLLGSNPGTKVEVGDSYKGLTVDQLVEILKERGLPTEGRKGELLLRLREADESA